MTNIAIHQFSPSAHRGDGITNGMFYLQKILHELGFKSHIYAENFEPELKNEVIHYTKFDSKDKNQVLFVHYSIYYAFNLWINKLDIQKIMIYHNITPYTFFEKGTQLYEMCKSGKEYLPELSSKVVGAIGDSTLNSDELQEHNFKNVKTIPLLMDLNTIEDADYNHKLFDENSLEFNIIFVGRIARNKAQHDLIEVANIYQHMCEDFKMYIIGSTTDPSYMQELRELINQYNLQDNVIITGKISNEDLYAYYRSSNLFLCMSEHEGFGIPLIESMLFDLPVMAYNSSNIKSTLNSGGILFNEKSPKHIAATIKLLRENVAFKTEVLNTQREAIKSYQHQIIVNELVSYLRLFDIEVDYSSKQKRDTLRYQFEGPFDSSYSLAMLNRYSALAFNKKYPDQVSLFSTEGGGDFTPDKNYLASNPPLTKISQLSKKAAQCDVVFRNLYPPRVTGMKGKLNLLNSYGWEESAFPKEYVDSFNENLDGITVMSKYVKNLLKNNGVRIPIGVVGLGAEHILTTKPKPIKLKTDKKFKFLHISSCFARKGVDTLLKAYVEVFDLKDDVCLIIKTFPNPHNDIETQIKIIQENNKNAPEIILINEDLSDAHISWLYQNSDCLVAPSRGEGFGLPMAEAMLFNLPVITTAFGGQSDFCTDETSWLIDYSFQKAQTHMNLFNSYWAEPEKESLKGLLKEQFSLTKEEKEIKTKKAYKLVSQEFAWSNYRQKTEDFIEMLKDKEIFDTSFKNIAWVSSYNTKCGIATYSEFIISNMNTGKFDISIFANYSDESLDPQKEEEIVRCWNNRFDENNQLLIDNILQGDFTHAVINFNFGFFSMKNLEEILNQLYDANIKTTIIFHSIADVTIEGLESSLSWIKESLKKADNLLVHNIEDLNSLKNLELKNMNFLPHGVQNRMESIEPKKESVTTISSYGFLLPHKGILELIEAFAILEKNIKTVNLSLVNAIYPVKESKDYYQLCRARVDELGLSHKVIFHTEYLSEEETNKLLDKADLLVMPYQNTNESSSAAVRDAVATLNPVLCTKEPIFNDVKDIVHFVDGKSIVDMANTLENLINDTELLHSKTNKQALWIEEHDWRNVALKVEDFLR